MTYLLITGVVALWGAAGAAWLADSPAARIDIDAALATDVAEPVSTSSSSAAA